MKSYKEPTPEDISKVIALIARVEQRRYFFDKLDNPRWILPLWEKGFFRNPPDAVKDDAKETIAYFLWPESRYLARMSAVDPESVFKVVMEIRQTDNVRVYEDILEAALQMPALLAAQLASKLINEVGSARFLLFPQKMGSLVEKLARDGQSHAALDVAKFLLLLKPNPKSDERAIEYKSVTIRLSSDPESMLNTWDYSQIIEKNVPVLVKAVGEPAFIFLCELLDTALFFYRNQNDCDDSDDYSYIWYQAIESNPDTNDIMELLVSAARDAAVSLIANSLASVRDVIAIIQGHRWAVFKRLDLYLLSKFGEHVIESVRDRLTDRDLFDSYNVGHEYSLLAREYFSQLSAADQTKVLSWIEDGPNPEDYKLGYSNWRGSQPTEAEVQAYILRWKRDRLTPIRDALPPTWLEKYESFIAKVGEPDNPDLLPEASNVWVGPSSPKNARELTSMPVDEIVAFLKDWVPSNNFMTPSPEGLGGELRSVVASDPTRFATNAELFIGLDPTYVRSLLAGLDDSIKQQHPFNWEPVVRLCEWVLKQPNEMPNRGKHEESDPDWSWTKKEIIDLLKAGFQSAPCSIPFNHREAVWQLVESVTNDANPTPEQEEQYGKGDAATYSLNTVRGQAMHAAIQYALWARRHFEQGADGERRLASGFVEMPEVGRVLERHLKINEDSSLAIRAVYGQWFPWLALLDKDWTRTNIRRIFPREDNLRDYWNAAWRAYITLNRPYDEVFEILRNEYDFAIDQMSNNEMKELIRFNPDEGLSEHLILLYWRGVMTLADDLIRRLFEKASEQRRGRIMAYVGRGLCDREIDISPNALSRLQALWVWRFETARSAPVIEAYTEELGAFGWWFASGRFENDWSISQLKDVLQLVGNIDLHSGVLERLAELSPYMPALTVDCLRLIIEGDKERWHIEVYKDSVRAILSAALRSEDHIVQDHAKTIINLLGSRGNYSYRDLLS